MRQTSDTKECYELFVKPHGVEAGKFLLSNIIIMSLINKRRQTHCKYIAL